MNVKNRTVYCNDNLAILKGINNDTIDLIYLDPPFNSGKDYAAPRKSMAAGAEFKDKWDEDDMNIEWWFDIKKKHPKLYLYLKNVDDFSRQSNQTYLVMMAIRVLEMHRILKPTGSLYYHCDHSMSHYVKIMLDIIFGLRNFKNNIVWCYKSGGASKNHFSKKHDDIFFYTKSKKYTYHAIKEKSYYADPNRTKSPNGVELSRDEKGAYIEVLPKDYWLIPILPITSKERTGWPTQKPLTLMHKIIEASSNEGDVVLDPFCGCATTCVAAEQLNRKWVGIDVWEGAHHLIQERLNSETNLFTQGLSEVHKLTKPPKRTDTDPKRIEKKKRKYVSDEIKEAVYERDNGACKSCGAKEELQYDHIIPFSKGGSDEIDNLQILCRSCNLAKSNKYHG